MKVTHMLGGAPLLAAVFGASSALAAPATLSVESTTLTYRVPVSDLVQQAPIVLPFTIGGGKPPEDIVDIEVTRGTGTPICKATLDKGSYVATISYEPPSPASSCAWVYGLAPDEKVDVRVITARRDEVRKLALVAGTKSSSALLLDGCIGKPEELRAACKARNSTPADPKPLLLVDAEDVNDLAFRKECYLLASQWTRCWSTDPTEISEVSPFFPEAWRMVSGKDTRAVYIRAAGPTGGSGPYDYKVDLAPLGEEKKAPKSEKNPAWCTDTWKRNHPDAGEARYLLCIDQSDPTSLGSARLLSLPDGAGGPSEATVILANTPLTVLVQYPVTVGATLSSTGTVGFETEGVVQSDAAVKAGLPTPPAAPSNMLYLESTFPSFKAGEAGFQVTLKERKETSPATYTHTYKVYVDRQVWGAFRSGLSVGYAFPRDGAPYDRYDVVTPSGSSTPTVSDLGPGGWLESELSFGLSLYFHKKARPVLESRLATPRGAFYLGLGVVDLTASNAIDALPALHVGPELSLGRNTGIALVASLRPAKALALGIQPDDYAEADPLPSRIVILPGVSLVLNLTPDMLQLAKK